MSKPSYKPLGIQFFKQSELRRLAGRRPLLVPLPQRGVGSALWELLNQNWLVSSYARNTFLYQVSKKPDKKISL